jgi:GntR family transcriptional regulator, transcriptional repressor for pyruvate dehydrogenase complex
MMIAGVSRLAIKEVSHIYILTNHLWLFSTCLVAMKRAMALNVKLTAPPKTALRPPRQGPVERAVRQLQEDCLAAPEGAALGSEEELLARFGVSRPTLRQATRLLEYQGLMRVRRGPGGGYFARRPDVTSVADVAAIYLRSRQTPMTEIVAAAHSYSIEAMVRAALSSRDPAKEALSAMAAELASLPPEEIPADIFVAQEVAMTELIYQLVESAPLELMSRVFSRFGTWTRGGNVFERRPDRRKLWRALRLELVEAIIASDRERVREISGKLNQLSAQWVLPDEAPPKGKAPGLSR